MANTLTDEDYADIIEKFLRHGGEGSSFKFKGNLPEVVISLDGGSFGSIFSFEVSLKELSEAESEEEVNAILAGLFYSAFTNSEREDLFDDFFPRAEYLEFTYWEIVNWVIGDINFFINLANKFADKYLSEQDDRVRELFFKFADTNDLSYLHELRYLNSY